MDSGKRASMREGPLAALFRRTEEENQDAEAEPGAADSAAEAARPAPEPRAEAPEPQRGDRPPVPRAQARDAAWGQSRLTERPEEETPAPEREVAPPTRFEKRGAPARHSTAPATAASAESPPPARRDDDERPPLSADRPWQTAAEIDADDSTPSPRERLGRVFSSDIPEPPQPAGQRDPYARATVVAPARAPRAIGQPVLRVVGVGGAGVNAVNRMVEAEVEGVEFLAVNTDLQSLQQSSADVTLHIGAQATRGLGSGSNPDLGREAALEEFDKVKALLKGSDMVFVTAGAGGGTGTGAAPIVARIARELGALTVGIVTKPFGFEGSRRRDQAELGISLLREEVDTLIVVPNNRLLSVLEKSTSMVEAFRVADDVLRQGVQGVSDLVTLPGLINLDFADVRTIMGGAGNALLGIGMGTGDRRAIDASEKAVASPLLETSMDGARAILLSITGGKDLSLWEVNEAARAVAEAAHPDANIIFGAMVDEKLGDQVWVTVVATGYEERPQPRPKLREPQGEPRVSRGAPTRPVSTAARPERPPTAEPIGAPVDDDLEIPEFVPRR